MIRHTIIVTLAALAALIGGQSAPAFAAPSCLSRGVYWTGKSVVACTLAVHQSFWYGPGRHARCRGRFLATFQPGNGYVTKCTLHGTQYLYYAPSRWVRCADGKAASFAPRGVNAYLEKCSLVQLQSIRYGPGQNRHVACAPGGRIWFRHGRRSFTGCTLYRDQTLPIGAGRWVQCMGGRMATFIPGRGLMRSCYLKYQQVFKYTTGRTRRCARGRRAVFQAGYLAHC
jgi:hypothetical protein